MTLRSLILSFFLLVSCAAAAQDKLMSPETFLGYPLGAKYTPHHRIVTYFRHVAATSPATMKLVQYGETNEGRPLLLAFLSSPENIANLDKIRVNNMKMAGLGSDNLPPDLNAPVLVWLSYNVHGNEPSSSEAAMKTIHALADPGNARSVEWLKHTVVVIDPCINPDGRDRYVNWYNSVTGVTPNPDPQSREHREPWPGGRVNHYYFDLNRDWAWQSQKESQQRLKVYNEWMPQVHVDFHEQGFNQPYYFAPAAEPYHEVITPWQREFQGIIGRNNAKYFDAHGWLYFTKERFDLFYPSYGDTYPTYNGAIGMTFEQGGGPRGGRAVLQDSGDTLTLADRLEHHYTTGLSTVEMSVMNRERLLKEFRSFFIDAQNNGSGPYKTYVVKADASRTVPAAVKKYLDQCGIKYGYATAKSPAKGFGYVNNKEESFSIDPGDLVISGYQPRSNMLRVLFEPRSKLTDSLTYDITAWAIPYAMGLDAWAVREKILPAQTGDRSGAVQAQPVPDAAANALAYAIPWNGTQSVKLLSALQGRGVKVRYADQAFTAQGKTFPAGTLLVAKTSNGGEKASLLPTILNAANDAGGLPGDVTPIVSGYMDKGADLGSSHYPVIDAPHVALLAGDQVRANAMGEIWHFFEQELHYPITLVNATDINAVSLRAFNVLILPQGNYRMLSDKSMSDALKNWIQEGGRLIALEDAVSQMSTLDWAIKRKKDSDKKEGEGKEKGKDSAAYSALHRYEDREREDASSSVPGAIYKVSLDNSHPLAFGFPEWYFTLKQDEDVYEYFKDGGWNVGYLKKDNYVYGFAGVKSKKKLTDGLLFGVQDLGRGHIVYLADDVIFRSFWEKGKLMLSNAVFLVGQ